MNGTAPRGGSIRDEFQPGSRKFSSDDSQSAPVTPNHGPCVSSRAVSWWSVHEFVAPVLARVGSWPMAGTVEWNALPDDDPRRIAAIFDAAQHHALRMETGQQAECEASRAISAAEDWSWVAAQVREREEFYTQKPWLRRRTES
jgi:Protein of unknown function (DUF2742)